MLDVPETASHKIVDALSRGDDLDRDIRGLAKIVGHLPRLVERDALPQVNRDVGNPRIAGEGRAELRKRNGKLSRFGEAIKAVDGAGLEPAVLTVGGHLLDHPPIL